MPHSFSGKLIFESNNLLSVGINSPPSPGLSVLVMFLFLTVEGCVSDKDDPEF